jgi:predicted Zn finger-like uncharacterized protein
MKVTCDSCNAQYTIADDKVSGRRVKVKCKSCGNTLVVDGTALGRQAQAAPAASAAPDAMKKPASGGAPLPAGSWSVNLADDNEKVMTVPQIVAGYLDHSVTDDAFVWRDGMDDWVALRKVAELDAAISQAKAAAPDPGDSEPTVGQLLIRPQDPRRVSVYRHRARALAAAPRQPRSPLPP